MIESFKIQDLDNIMSIWLETNVICQPFVDKDYWEKNYDAVKDLIPQADVYMYRENGIIQGFVGVAESSYIAGIFVSQKWQSKGIGKKLLNHCKDIYTKLELDVYCKNQSAVAFYEKNDFCVSEEKTDADTNEQEYRMLWSR